MVVVVVIAVVITKMVILEEVEEVVVVAALFALLICLSIVLSLRCSSLLLLSLSFTIIIFIGIIKSLLSPFISNVFFVCA